MTGMDVGLINAIWALFSVSALIGVALGLAERFFK